jgi:hypothetical protein
MARAIFISYRREDSEGEAGRLFDDLVRTWGDDSVFMDVSGIVPGTDFRKAIDDNVATCGVLLAVIGPAWATIADGSGQRRLDDPNDFVRLEIASALARNIPVIPVLVHDAKMPRPEQLPDGLKDFAFRNSVELSHTRWNSDVQLLTSALGQYIAVPAAKESAPMHAVLPVQLPPAQAGPVAVPPRKRSVAPWAAGVAVFLIFAAAGTFLVQRVLHPSSSPTAAGGTATPASLASTQPASAAIPAAANVQPSAPAGSVPAWVSSIQGTWANSAPVGTEVLNKLEIAATDGQVSMHAWGLCRPADCDWGSQTASLAGVQATATWNLQQVTRGQHYDRQLVISVTPADNALRVLTKGTSTSPGEPVQHGHGRFQFVRMQ